MTQDHFGCGVAVVQMCLLKLTRTVLLMLLAFQILLPTKAEAQQRIDEPKEAKASPTDQTDAPLTITLQDALDRARANSPQFQAAILEYQLAREDRVQARAALLPTALYNHQYLYT
ncbi:MAG: hypothetical protein ACHQKY_16915, partial [Terriglobia bacterium]